MAIEDIINSVGVFLVLLAFFLLMLGKLKSYQRSYLLTNLAGASLACYGSWLIHAIPFVVLEGTWAIVALAGLIKTTRVKKSRQQQQAVGRGS